MSVWPKPPVWMNKEQLKVARTTKVVDALPLYLVATFEQLADLHLVEVNQVSVLAKSTHI
jgi:hypothetical protein